MGRHRRGSGSFVAGPGDTPLVIAGGGGGVGNAWYLGDDGGDATGIATSGGSGGDSGGGGVFLANKVAAAAAFLATAPPPRSLRCSCPAISPMVAPPSSTAQVKARLPNKIIPSEETAGFGGGGAGGNWGGGGGGGYTGGDGGNYWHHGQGGSSYDAGQDQQFSLTGKSVNSDGSVTITPVSAGSSPSADAPIVGTPENDTSSGGSGNDQIPVGNGNDVALCGHGSDHLDHGKTDDHARDVAWANSFPDPDNQVDGLTAARSRTAPSPVSLPSWRPRSRARARTTTMDAPFLRAASQAASFWAAKLRISSFTAQAILH